MIFQADGPCLREFFLINPGTNLAGIIVGSVKWTEEIGKPKQMRDSYYIEILLLVRGGIY